MVMVSFVGVVGECDGGLGGVAGREDIGRWDERVVNAVVGIAEIENVRRDFGMESKRLQQSQIKPALGGKTAHPEFRVSGTRDHRVTELS